MKATKSPSAFAMAVFRVRAMFWRGSTQYLIATAEVDETAATSGLADSRHKSIPVGQCKLTGVDEIVGETLHGEAPVGRW